MTRRRPDRTRNSTSRRLNSCLLIDTTATAHLPGPQNPRECHLYLAEGCHLYIALTCLVAERRFWKIPTFSGKNTRGILPADDCPIRRSKRCRETSRDTRGKVSCTQ